jgi:hypothetical protein
MGFSDARAEHLRHTLLLCLFLCHWKTWKASFPWRPRTFPTKWSLTSLFLKLFSFSFRNPTLPLKPHQQMSRNCPAMGQLIQVVGCVCLIGRRRMIVKAGGSIVRPGLPVEAVINGYDGVLVPLLGGCLVTYCYEKLMRLSVHIIRAGEFGCNYPTATGRGSFSVRSSLSSRLILWLKRNILFLLSRFCAFPFRAQSHISADWI